MPVLCDADPELAPSQRKKAFAWLHDLFIPSCRLPDEYLLFQALDCVQAACSYLRGVLTLHSTLMGAGIDSTSSSGAAATVLAFILKDASGHIGSLTSSYWLSSHLDAELKTWRLAADLANDVGLTLELFAPLCGPRYFLAVTCAANVCKALCGVAAGGTRVAISQHFGGRTGNVAEIAAKEGAQETAVTLFGLLVGYYCATALTSSLTVQWVAFTALTIVHVLANYWAVKCLRLASINRSRAYMLADAFCDALQTKEEPALVGGNDKQSAAARAPTAARGGVAAGRPGAPPRGGALASSTTGQPPQTASWTWNDVPTPAAVALVEPVLLPVRYAGRLLQGVSPALASALQSGAQALGGRVVAEGATTGVFSPSPSRLTVPVRIRLGASVSGLHDDHTVNVCAIAVQPDAATLSPAYVSFGAVRGQVPELHAGLTDFLIVALHRKPRGAFEVSVTPSVAASDTTTLLGYVAAVRLARSIGSELHPGIDHPTACAQACAEVSASAAALFGGLTGAGWDCGALRLDVDEPHRVAIADSLPAGSAAPQLLPPRQASAVAHNGGDMSGPTPAAVSSSARKRAVSQSKSKTR